MENVRKWKISPDNKQGWCIIHEKDGKDGDGKNLNVSKTTKKDNENNNKMMRKWQKREWKKAENGKSVNGKRQKMAKVFKKATVVCVPKCPEWRWCISVFFFPLSLLHNFERLSTLLAHTLSFYLHPEIKFDIPWAKIKQDPLNQMLLPWGVPHVLKSYPISPSLVETDQCLFNVVESKTVLQCVVWISKESRFNNDFGKDFHLLDFCWNPIFLCWHWGKPRTESWQT